MKVFKVIDKIINYMLIIIFILLAIFAIYAILDVKEIYDESNISTNILNKIKEKDYSIIYMQETINKDICAWIKIDDTGIDYPVVFPKDNSEYLELDYKREYSPLGSVFIDQYNDRYFKDDFTIMYAHNSSNSLMFSDIKKYKDIEFFKSHLSGKLYTEKKVYNIKIYSVNLIKEDIEFFYKVDTYKNGYNKLLLDNLNNSITNKSDLNIEDNDKIIMLSTCNKIGSKERLVLIGILEEL